MGCDDHATCNSHACNNACESHNHHGEELIDIVKEYRDNQKNRCVLFENPIFDELFDGAIRPGGLSITKRAMELCKFEKGAKILDVGCGYGATVEYLQNNYDVEAMGIDLSTVLIEKGKLRNPKLNLSFGDGEMMDFPSLTFDGVFIECALSLMDSQMEAVHEAYCVLKKGGKLVISDFYINGDESNLAPTVLEPMLLDIGFKILHREEKDKELKEFTASLIMHYGSLDAFFKATAVEGEKNSFLAGIGDDRKAGYFLLIAEKM